MVAKWSKCELMVPSIEFLGYRADAEGRHPTDEKIAAINEDPRPKNVTKRHSYLGLHDYYGTSYPTSSHWCNRYMNCFER